MSSKVYGFRNEAADEAYRARHGEYPPERNGDGIYANTQFAQTPKELPPSMPFPIDAMPEHCRRLIREASSAIGCAPEMVGVPMLAVLGASVGNSRRIKVKGGWTEGATVYTAVIAEPGEKKSPAQAVAIDPVMRKQARLRNEYERKLDEHNRELRQYEVDKADARKDGVAAPPPP